MLPVIELVNSCDYKKKSPNFPIYGLLIQYSTPDLVIGFTYAVVPNVRHYLGLPIQSFRLLDKFGFTHMYVPNCIFNASFEQNLRLCGGVWGHNVVDDDDNDDDDDDNDDKEDYTCNSVNFKVRTSTFYMELDLDYI